MVPKIRNDLEPHYQLHQVCKTLLREVGKYLTHFLLKKASLTFGLLKKKFSERDKSQIFTMTLGKMEN